LEEVGYLATEIFLDCEKVELPKNSIMQEHLQDETRDELTDHLNAIGVSSVLAERDRTEELAGNRKSLRSLGIIDIDGGTIYWANVVKKDPSKDSPERWFIQFGVPDERAIPKEQSVKIKTKRKKAFPAFGKVAEVKWEGQDRGLGLVKGLTSNNEISQMATDLGNIEVRSLHDDFQGWHIQFDRKIEPTIDHWEALEELAEILLSSVRRF